MAALIPYKDTWSTSESTPVRYRSSEVSHNFHHVTPVPSNPSAVLAALRKNPVACRTRVEQLEIECLMALEALSMTSDFEENAPQFNPSFRTVTLRGEELQFRYRIAREKYKTELWNRDFEPVLQRIHAAAATITIADLEKNAKSMALRQLMAAGCVVRKEKDVLDGLLDECVRMGAILGDVGNFLGTLSRTGGHRGSLSNNVYGAPENRDTSPTQNLESEQTTVTNAELLETTAKYDSKDEEGIGFQTYCDHIFTSLQTLYIKANETSPSTFLDNNSSVPTVPAPLITHLYTAVTEQIASVQLKAENASLSAAMVRERKQLNALFTEVQCRNEEDLSLAAGLVIEAVNVQAQVEQVRAAARADLGVSVKIREEIARRRGAGCLVADDPGDGDRTF